MSAHECLREFLQKTLQTESCLNFLFSILIQQAAVEGGSPAVGVCLMAIGWTVEIDDFMQQCDYKQKLLQPLFRPDCLYQIVNSPLVSNRKALFDLLVILALRLGQPFVDGYLEPRDGAGLSIPNFKLFQVLLEQKKNSVVMML